MYTRVSFMSNKESDRFLYVIIVQSEKYLKAGVTSYPGYQRFSKTRAMKRQESKRRGRQREGPLHWLLLTERSCLSILVTPIIA